ncbi:MAG TPA: hypothetical protein VE309_05715 [Caulobacteraceae bacterium]|jgi:hypothetical protein|nr:hypothetical protein [Caulobacteraceae bacterium]
MSRNFPSVVAGLAAALVLGGCAKQIAAPTTTGVCWQAIPLKDGGMRFNKVSEGEPNMESCAASLEGMRLRFLSLGGNNQEMIGAYQGNFLFLERNGIFMSQSFNGNRYFALGRTSDGRLATAAALSQQP